MVWHRCRLDSERSVALERTRRSRQATLFPGAATGLRWQHSRAQYDGNRPARFHWLRLRSGTSILSGHQFQLVLVKGVTLRPGAQPHRKNRGVGDLRYTIREFLPVRDRRRGHSKANRSSALGDSDGFVSPRTGPYPCYERSARARSSNVVPDLTATLPFLPVDYVVDVFSMRSESHFRQPGHPLFT